jgi:hypothetical protein
MKIIGGMYMKTYNELVNEVKEELANGGKRSFSRELFNDLTAAYLNDVEGNKITVAKTKNGEVVEEEMTVPLEFRKMIMKILLDFGVDKQEAERVLTNDYQLRDVNALYGVASELILNYAGTGKKFNFIPKPDLQCSLIIDDYDEEIKVTKRPGADDSEAREVKYKKHRKVKVESVCPSWLRELVK